MTILNRSCSIQHSMACGNMNGDLYGCSFVKRDLTLIVLVDIQDKKVPRRARPNRTQVRSYVESKNVIQFTPKPVTIVIENTLSRILKYDRHTAQFCYRSLLGLKREFLRKSCDMGYWRSHRHHVPYSTKIMYNFAKTSVLYGAYSFSRVL